MSKIAQDLISKFSAAQPQVWQTVTQSVTEAAGFELTFNDALTLATGISELYSEMGSPKLIVQFAFADNPDNPQVILIGQETFKDIYQAITGKEVESVDDSLLPEIRDSIEAIVQGLCIASGNIRDEAMVASGLTIRLQIFSFPQNMQNVEELIRTNVRVSGEGVNGNLIWLVDEPTSRTIVNMGSKGESGSVLGETVEGKEGGTSNAKASLPDLDDTGLELLLDIPLEVSVELGRVRMVVKDVIELGSGSIVEIDKAAGEPVDVLVNGRLVARGEVVVIEDNFGVRITEILSPADRLAKLNEVA